MDTKRTSNSVCKSSGSTIGEEFVQRPLHSDHGLNGISWLNLDHTAWGKVELKDVNNTEESVLSAFRSTDRIILFGSVIEAVGLDEYFVSVNAEGASVWIEDSQDESCFTVLGFKGEGLVLWSIACVFDLINISSLGVDDNWITRCSELTGVETIPNVIHVGVDFVFDFSALLLHIDWCKGPVDGIPVVIFEHEDAQSVTDALVSIPILF